ncbi:hypothetical protein [Actinoplanes sp. NPDC020271]|uniref:hypothetical protein n=1 Tax=Actinoplanes sp. NPDC020271 TaxID=3363896 RepID=UPI0037BCC5A9
MRLPQLILQAFTTLGETLYPVALPGHFPGAGFVAARAHEEAYYRAAFAEMVRREWGAGALPATS